MKNEISNEDYDSFRLIGRITFIKSTLANNGSCVTSLIVVRKKNKNSDEQESFPVKFYTTKLDNTAERIKNECSVGDYIHIVGKLGNFIKDKDAKMPPIELVGWRYGKLLWNTKENKYVYANQAVDTE